MTLVEEYESSTAINFDIGPIEYHVICCLNTLEGIGWIEWPYQESKGCSADYLFRARYDSEQAQTWLSDKWKPCPNCGESNAFVELNKERVCLRCQKCHLMGTLKGWYEQPNYAQRPKRKTPLRRQKKSLIVPSNDRPISLTSMPKTGNQADFTKESFKDVFDFRMEVEQ
jgi:ribosomal protein S27AE